LAEGSAGEPGRSHHAVAGRPGAAGDGTVRRRRAAVAELAEALRGLIEQAVATEVAEDDLRRVAAQIREATIPLSLRTRGRGQLPSADDLPDGIRMYNPVTGSGSALAPPLHIELAGDMVVGTCTLGLAYEGPPTCVHGGVSAMLLDQLLGYTASAAGHPGMTVQLDTTYRAPVPLQAPLRLTARMTEVTGRRATVRGTIATAAEPDTVLVEARGIFVGLRPEQAARLFSAVQPDATDPAIGHD
jgi:hypothetical protein